MSRNPDTVSSIWNQTQDIYHLDLQTAIDESAPYDVIMLPPGDIAESITLNKSLTITGCIHTPTVFKQTDIPASQSIYITGENDVNINNLMFNSVSAAVVIEDSTAGVKNLSGLDCFQTDHLLLVGGSNNINLCNSSVLNYEDMKDTWKILAHESHNVCIDNIVITYSESQDMLAADMIYTDGNTNITRTSLYGTRTGVWIDGDDVLIDDVKIVSNMNRTPGSISNSILITSGGNNIKIYNCSLHNLVNSNSYHVNNLTSSVINATHNYWGEQIIYDDRDITTTIRINNDSTGDVLTSPYWKDGPHTELVHFEYE